MISHFSSYCGLTLTNIYPASYAFYPAVPYIQTLDLVDVWFREIAEPLLSVAS